MSYDQVANIWRVIGVLGAISVAVGGYLSYSYGKKADAERAALQRAKEATSGVLVPSAAPKRNTFPYPEISFGDSDSVILWAGPQFAPALGVVEDNNLFVALDAAGRVQVSAQIRDHSGALLAEIVQNEWKVRPAKIWDRNYNPNSFEVRGESGDVVLQIRLEGRRVQLQARLYDANGRGMAFGKGIGPDGKVGGLMEFQGPGHPKLLLKFEPLFVYPSESHLGELRTASARH